MSIILAKVLGLYFLFIGLAFLLNPKRLGGSYEMIQKSDAFLFFGGGASILMGAVIVAIHNVWVFGWPVLITILGWWGLIKGLGILTCPRCVELLSSMAGRSELFYRGIGGVLSLIGLFLLYHGWGVAF